jgi:hypothetical protein
MRSMLAILSAAAILGAGSAYAEKRLFIIGSSPDGYGIDRCLASGATCGSAAAAAYCRSRDFKTVASFRKVDREEITGGVSARAAKGCIGAGCADFVAIECIR